MSPSIDFFLSLVRALIKLGTNGLGSNLGIAGHDKAIKRINTLKAPGGMQKDVIIQVKCTYVFIKMEATIILI